MEVIGISRHGKPVEGFSQVLTPKALVEVLPKADFVLMATPLTPETENLLDRQKQALIKPGAGIINVGRSGTMDYDALVENLNRGHFSGAIIDVFDQNHFQPILLCGQLRICSSHPMSQRMTATLMLR